MWECMWGRFSSNTIVPVFCAIGVWSRPTPRSPEGSKNSIPEWCGISGPKISSENTGVRVSLNNGCACVALFLF